MVQEIKYTGVTSTPSDYECPDGELEVSMGLVQEEGGLEAVHIPGIIGTLGVNEELLLVHVVNSGGTRHIIYRDGQSLCYREAGKNEKKSIKTYNTATIKCSATGNVLCVYGHGAIDHFIFIRGRYYQLGTEDYNISVLFGIDAELKTRATTINNIFTNSNGASASTWENIYTQEYVHEGTDTAGGLQGMVVENITLNAGVKYRIHVTANETDEFFIRMNLYHDPDDRKDWTSEPSDGTAVSRFTPHEFTPERNVYRIFIAPVRGTAPGSTYVTVRFTGTITIDRVVNTISENAAFVYNSHDSVNNALYGEVNQLLESIKNENKFALPFFVRYGFRMIGGDIVTVSPPILIEPNTGVTPLVTADNITPNQTNTFLSANVSVNAYSGTLKYKVRDTEKLRKILEIEEFVDSLVIAVSDPIWLYKQDASAGEIQQKTLVTRDKPENKSYAISGELSIPANSDAYITLPTTTDSYEEKLKNVHTFRIIKEIKKDDISLNSSFTAVPLDNGALSGLASVQSILPDNVENLSTYDCDYVMSYNEREHLLGIQDNMFAGFDLDIMCGYVGTTEKDTNYAIECRLRESEDIQEIVRGKKSESSQNRRWLYYPDSKAISCTIYSGNKKTERIPLQQHPFLKGAFAFAGNVDYYDTSNTEVNAPMRTITSSSPNMLYVSASGNPLMVEQRIRVGDGILYAAASNTRPITRNQFGTAPLYVFSSDGIWGLEVATDGQYSVRQTVSRDVLAHRESITQLDNSVLFVTDRGIMLLSGSESICITDSLMTESSYELLPGLEKIKERNDAIAVSADIVPFRSFLNEARMLYDYTHQRIIVYNPEKDYAYVYNLKSKQWGMMPSSIKRGINYYPECLAIDKSNNILDFSAVAASDAEETTSSLLVTRPIKLQQPDVLKTIDTIIQRGKFRSGSVQSILYGSRDLIHWHLIASSRDHYLRGFRGTPYKYFRIVLLANLRKDESIFGCSVGYTPRMIERMR